MRGFLNLVFLSVVLAQQLPTVNEWTFVTSYGSFPSKEVPPPGCVCLTASCQQWDCPCVCDRSAAMCDENCCCDADCSAIEVARFKNLGTCLPEGPKNLSVVSCVSSDISKSLVYVNPKSRMSVDSSSSGADAVLCVSVDNTPLLGDFIADPGSLEPNVLSLSSVARPFSFKQASSTTSFPAGPSTSATAYFDVGARIPKLSGGFWSMPQSISSQKTSSTGAACSLSVGTFVLFRNDVSPPSQCFASKMLTQDACDSFSPLLYTGTKIGTYPGAISANEFVSISTTKIFSIDSATGVVTTANPPATSSVYSNSTGCSCLNAVVGLSYTVSYNSASQKITAVGVTIVTTDLAQSANVCGVVPLSIPVSTSVTFVPDIAPIVSSSTYSTSSEIFQGRSGGPGYVRGSPVLSGVIVSSDGAVGSGIIQTSTTKTAIARSASPNSFMKAFENLAGGVGFSLAGLTIRGPKAGGSCAAFPQAGTADSASLLPVTFGEDMAVSCELKLTRSQLQSLCSSLGGAQSSTATYIGLGSVSTDSSSTATISTHIGNFGNADPWKTWQWHAINLPTSGGSSGPAWDSVNGRCTNLVSGVDIEFLVAPIGSAQNPQFKIMASRLSYSTSTWSYTRPDSQKQTFLLTSTVTFTYYSKGDLTTVYKPAPQIAPSMPSDIWYPFGSSTTEGKSQIFVSSGSSSTVPALFAALAVIVSCLTLIAL